MQFRKLGHTDMDVSTVAFGCWAIVGGFTWGDQDEADSLAALRSAFDTGVNFFDTAEGYGGGASEQLLGRALGDVRDQIVIASKASRSHHRPADLREACERSLQNLGTDRIDLYQLHWPNWNVPFEETLGTLDELKAEGKILSYGVSNFGPRDLGDLLATGRTVETNQVAYNLLFRAIEYEIQPICAREGIGILCYSPMMQGLLTGKFACPADVPADRARTRHYSGERPEARHGDPGAEAETFAAVRAVREIAEGLGEPMANVSLAWLLAQEAVTCVIAGGRNAEQAKANTAAADLVLPQDAIGRLTEATEALKQTLGPNADMWQSESRIR
jgi:aryl-alcohol dehydrogenase-like predicted oxidoreductase